jgi:hypothetical protein
MELRKGNKMREEDVGLEGDCLRNFKLKGKAQRYCFAF